MSPFLFVPDATDFRVAVRGRLGQVLPMPRTARAMVSNGHYHAMNRANNRATIFHSDDDYSHFLSLICRAQQRIPLRLLAACLMPNHVHLVVAQDEARDLSRWMQWLLTVHAHEYNQRWDNCGRVWQGRYKAFPIQHDGHLLSVIRYVERNAMRAGLVDRAEAWDWGSLSWRLGRSPGPALAQPPCQLPANWVDFVNDPQSCEELKAIRTCARRQRPYGSDQWAEASAAELGLLSSVRGVGRPRGSHNRQPATKAGRD